MNDRIKYGASFHPNPYMHATMARKHFYEHKWHIKNLVSPIRQMMDKPRKEIPPRMCRSQIELKLHKQVPKMAKDGHVLYTMPKSVSRPGSAASAGRKEGNHSTRPPSAGSVKPTASNTAKPGAKNKQNRPQSAGPNLGRYQQKVEESWAPFEELNAKSGSGGPVQSPHKVNPARDRALAAGGDPKPNKPSSTADPSAKLSSAVVLGNVIENLQATLDDLDGVETNLALMNNAGSKKKVQSIKLQFAELSKQLDDVQADLFKSSN